MQLQKILYALCLCLCSFGLMAQQEQLKLQDEKGEAVAFAHVQLEDGRHE